jgi:hypothetical protein
VEKKKLLTTAFISMLLLSVVLVALFVNFGRANPFLHTWEKEGEVSPPAGTMPPEILILSPTNKTAYASNNVSLTFNVSIPESNNVSSSINEIYYRASWQQLKKTSVNLKSPKYNLPQISINLTDVPEGPRWLEVYATAEGGFAHWTRNVTEGYHKIQYYVTYSEITSSSLVNFTIDTTPPIISALSVENKTYSTPNATLNVIVNEPISQVIYSLNGQRNVTAAGNTTLINLPEGEHNLTVYVSDTAGNTGNSKTVHFSVDVPEPFPTAPVAASGASIAVLGIGLLVYFKKRKR